jgi:hypothetical protein
MNSSRVQRDIQSLQGIHSFLQEDSIAQRHKIRGKERFPKILLGQRYSGSRSSSARRTIISSKFRASHIRSTGERTSKIFQIKKTKVGRAVTERS